MHLQFAEIYNRIYDATKQRKTDKLLAAISQLIPSFKEKIRDQPEYDYKAYGLPDELKKHAG